MLTRFVAVNYRYVLLATVATIHYLYAKNVKCSLVGEFADPGVDPLFKLCAYSCSDRNGRIQIWPISQPCPEIVNAVWGIPWPGQLPSE